MLLAGSEYAEDDANTELPQVEYLIDGEIGEGIDDDMNEYLGEGIAEFVRQELLKLVREHTATRVFRSKAGALAAALHDRGSLSWLECETYLQGLFFEEAERKRRARPRLGRGQSR